MEDNHLRMRHPTLSENAYDKYIISKNPITYHFDYVSECDYIYEITADGYVKIKVRKIGDVI